MTLELPDPCQPDFEPKGKTSCGLGRLEPLQGMQQVRAKRYSIDLVTQHHEDVACKRARPCHES